MSFEFRPAIREQVTLLLGLIGPSGGGKTYTAMRLAKGICGDKPFAVIDTEAGRAKHYAELFKFDHGDLKPPFRPDSYAEAIKKADEQGYGAIVVDSFSHEWAGEGGILEWQEEELSAMVKRAMDKRENAKEWDLRETFKMSSWIKPKTSHKHMIQRLLQVRANLILCFRAEEKIKMEKNSDTGKMMIIPMGYQPVCSKEMPYELTVSFLLTPDKPGIPQPIKLQEQHKTLFPLDKQVNEDSGKKISEWGKGRVTQKRSEEKKEPQANKKVEEFLTIMKREHDRIGAEKFFDLLNSHGFETIEEITEREKQVNIYKELLSIKVVGDKVKCPEVGGKEIEKTNCAQCLYKEGCPMA